MSLSVCSMRLFVEISCLNHLRKFQSFLKAVIGSHKNFCLMIGLWEWRRTTIHNSQTILVRFITRCESTNVTFIISKAFCFNLNAGVFKIVRQVLFICLSQQSWWWVRSKPSKYITSEFSMMQSGYSGFFWPWPLELSFVICDLQFTQTKTLY